LALLQKLDLAIPRHVTVKAQVDTGAMVSGFTRRAFQELELPSVGLAKILTPSTRPESPHVCDLYDVGLLIVADGQSHPFSFLRVIASDGWHPDREDGVEGLIGRDVLNRAYFQYHGPGASFTFAF
jgi:hypothetical protein